MAVRSSGANGFTLRVDFEWTPNFIYDPDQDTGIPSDALCAQTSPTSCTKVIAVPITTNPAGITLTVSLLRDFEPGETAFVTAEIEHGPMYVDRGQNSDVETMTFDT